MIQFANPAFLWALTGIFIPIGIHMLSRKEGKIIRLGSIRHVEETSTQQFRGIRLNEILLLILRCLLIVLLSLIMSGIGWNATGNKRWLMIEKGLENQPSLALLIDSLGRQGYESHLLAADFPLLEDSAGTYPVADYAELVEQLEKKNLQEAIVVAQNKPGGFSGVRRALPNNVRWISQSLGPVDFTLQAYQIAADSIALRQGQSNASETSFETVVVKNKVTGIKSEPVPTIKVLVIADVNYAYDRKVIKAALMAIEKSMPVHFSVTSASSEDTPLVSGADWLIWLSESRPPASPVNLIYTQLSSSRELFLKTKSNRWVLTKRLNEEIALEKNLAVTLAVLLAPNQSTLNEISNSNDRRLLPDSIAWSNIDQHAAGISSPFQESGNIYLLALLLVLLFIERLIAYQRNQ